MTRWQVRRTILTQAVILAALGLVPGTLAGVAVAYLINLATMTYIGHPVAFQLHPVMMAVSLVIPSSSCWWPLAFPPSAPPASSWSRRSSTSERRVAVVRGPHVSRHSRAEAALPLVLGEELALFVAGPLDDEDQPGEAGGGGDQAPTFMSRFRSVSYSPCSTTGTAST